MAQSKVVQHLVTALENLRKERVAVEARIATIEKLVSRQSAVEKAAAKAQVTKRGRKPAEAPAAKKAGKAGKASKAAKPAKAAKAAKAPRGKKKPHWSPAARAAARERMRKYWADRRRKG